ncbi:MAG: response regulator [Candidatus Cryptobacteroides sp.]|nr:response regulator [Bacteroidales bacterium]MDY5495556.1 response regulator [Candidatus Cryptobacteroides sp.]
MLPIFLFSCHRKAAVPDVERGQIDSVVYSVGDADSLARVMDSFISAGNLYGEMVAARELGKKLRNASQFYEAIDVHKRGLVAAEKLRDTVQIVQALNNIGTNYRRLAILDEASSYHYQALTYCDQYSGSRNPDDRTARKNRVVSLNGIGNVQLTLGNADEAENAFRQALKGENELGSALGQAINYANLGSILESREMLDSARYYYGKSLEFNEKVKSDLGVSLCHAHFGRLAEKEGDYDTAIEEYRQAYDIMEGNSDVWHWLESAVSLVRAYINAGNLERASFYLAKAGKEAGRISSMEYLAEVNRLEYLISKKKGDAVKALEYYVRSREYADSVASEKNLNHIQNVRVRYERERKQNEIELLNRSWEAERKNRNALLTMSLIALFLTIATIIVLIFLIALRNRNQRIIKEMERMKSTFFTNITHEFRTPLSVVQAAAGDVLNRSSDPEVRRDALDILRHGKGLLNLINQILDIAKLTEKSAVKAVPEWKYGDIVGFISMICESHRPFAQTAGVRLVFSSPVEELEMDFIPDYVQKIVGNLLSNAVKFSPSGADVLLFVKQEEADVHIIVCDKGVGMTAEQKDKIFIPFYQAPTDSQRIGSGIGLSLVKLSVEAMNGRVDVHSAPGEGTVFIVRIPLAYGGKVSGRLNMAEYNIPEADTLATTRLEINEDIVCGTDSFSILIIEDTAEVARWQMKQLGEGYSYYFASDGESGLARAEEIIPDLIITDIMMPGMDGYEVCRRIRSSELLNHIPVIMVTAKATHEDRMKGLAAGADAYLEKPFHADELAVRVSKLLEQRKLLQSKWEAVIRQGEPVEENPAANELPDADRAFVGKFTDAVNKCFETGTLDYDFIASEMCLTRSHMNRKLKAITGMTSTEYIKTMRISLAKALIDTTDMKIEAIAMRCGVDDVAYFSSLFRKATGMTPTAWRSRNRG